MHAVEGWPARRLDVEEAGVVYELDCPDEPEEGEGGGGVYDLSWVHGLGGNRRASDALS